MHAFRVQQHVLSDPSDVVFMQGPLHLEKLGLDKEQGVYSWIKYDALGLNLP